MDHDTFRRAATALAVRRNASQPVQLASKPDQISNDAGVDADDLRGRLQAHLRAKPDDAAAWLQFGRVELHDGDCQRALTAFRHALRCAGENPALIIEAGQGIAETEGDPFHESAEAWRWLASVDPSPVSTASTTLDRETWCQLASGELHAALPALRARRRSGDRREALDLAMVLDALGEQAEACCLRARDALIHDKFSQALGLFDQAATSGGILAGYLGDYLHVLRRVGRGTDAIAFAARAEASGPFDVVDLVTVYSEWADALLDEWPIEVAHTLLTRAAEVTGSISLWVKRCRLLQPVSASAESLADATAQLERGVAELESALETGRLQSDPLCVSALEPLFYLGYQMDDSRALQRRYARLVTASLQHAFRSDESSALARSALEPRRRLRIGYATSFASSHTVARYFAGWLQHADREQFEIHLFPLASTHDWMTDYLAGQVEVLHPAAFEVADASKQIGIAALDVLVYLEVGMDWLTFHLATLRLASIQCVAWGHPLTTELPNIDWFISADGMDSETDAGHYSEQLVLLPGIGACLPAAQVPAVKPTRASFGFSDTDQLVLSPQSLFKYRPQDDAALAELLQACPKALLLFFEGEFPAWTHRLRKRLATACAAVGVSSDHRIRFLPRQTREGFLGINAICDVCMDTPGWSGGMTSMDALACGLPVVTLPGATMRSRQSAAMLRQLGVGELIAADAQDRLRIVSGLLDDPSWRAKVSQKIQDGHPLLFGDRKGLCGLEAFYRWVTGVPRTGDAHCFKCGTPAC